MGRRYGHRINRAPSNRCGNTNAKALSAFRHYVTDLWRRTLRPPGALTQRNNWNCLDLIGASAHREYEHPPGRPTLLALAASLRISSPEEYQPVGHASPDPAVALRSCPESEARN